MAYGIRLRDTSGNTFTMTPDAMTIVSAGSVSMPAGLNVDNTYGVDIDLPTSNIPVANIGVLVSPRVSTGSSSVIYTRYIDGSTLYYTTFYAFSASTFYTRNDTTGIMTAWSAGNRTANSKSTWNPILSIYPIAFWDKMGATTFTKIRLFAATAHLLRETHNDVNFSLVGSASGNPNFGTPDLIKDDNVGTYAGFSAYRSWGDTAYSESTYDGSMTITFSTEKVITSVVIVKGHVAWGYEANGSAQVNLYYAGSWHMIWSMSWGISGGQVEATYTITGRWKVTGIQVVGHCYCKKGSGYSDAASEFAVRELRAWGCSYTDDEENKVVYSIGSTGISTVDYLVGIKKYNF